MIAVDFSWARFTIPQLEAAGVGAVCRYLTGAGKMITTSELDGYLGAGIEVVLVFENTANDADGGASAGQANAIAANAAVTALGLPPSEAVVYFAADKEYPNSQDALPYWEGIERERPIEVTGCYGQGALCLALDAASLASYFWQSDSQSFPGNDVTQPITHLQQMATGAPLAGTDLDLICKMPDFGQWPRPVNPTPSKESCWMIPSACTDQGAVMAQLREWYAEYCTDPMTAETQSIYWWAWNTPPAEGGFGGDPDLMLAKIIDNANIYGHLRPPYNVHPPV